MKVLLIGNDALRGRHTPYFHKVMERLQRANHGWVPYWAPSKEAFQKDPKAWESVQGYFETLLPTFDAAIVVNGDEDAVPELGPLLAGLHDAGKPVFKTHLYRPELLFKKMCPYPGCSDPLTSTPPCALCYE